MRQIAWLYVESPIMPTVEKMVYGKFMLLERRLHLLGECYLLFNPRLRLVKIM